jgi:hypothetical protein
MDVVLYCVNSFSPTQPVSPLDPASSERKKMARCVEGSGSLLTYVHLTLAIKCQIYKIIVLTHLQKRTKSKRKIDSTF